MNNQEQSEYNVLVELTHADPITEDILSIVIVGEESSPGTITLKVNTSANAENTKIILDTIARAIPEED